MYGNKNIFLFGRERFQWSGGDANQLLFLVGLISTTIVVFCSFCMHKVFTSTSFFGNFDLNSLALVIFLSSNRFFQRVNSCVVLKSRNIGVAVSSS